MFNGLMFLGRAVRAALAAPTQQLSDNAGSSQEPSIDAQNSCTYLYQDPQGPFNRALTALDSGGIRGEGSLRGLGKQLLFRDSFETIFKIRLKPRKLYAPTAF